MLLKARRLVFWGLVIFSIFSLVLSPFGDLKDQVIGSAAWLFVGVIISEILFVAGAVIMALAMSYKVRNPFKLRRQVKRLLLAGFKSKLFWVGFWINAAGAMGTGVLMGAGIITALPPRSWGLMVIPCAELTSTIVLRRYALNRRRDHYPVSREK